MRKLEEYEQPHNFQQPHCKKKDAHSCYRCPGFMGTLRHLATQQRLLLTDDKSRWRAETHSLLHSKPLLAREYVQAQRGGRAAVAAFAERLLHEHLASRLAVGVPSSGSSDDDDSDGAGSGGDGAADGVAAQLDALGLGAART